MTPHMIDFIHSFAWFAEINGPVLEIGSYIEAGQDHLNLRRAFPRETQYLGVDRIEGAGVDRKVDMLDQSQVDALLDSYAPRVTLCLYVMEHVWDIKEAAQVLTKMWQRYPESWLFVSTHQQQAFHGTEKYPDYWRITAPGMKRLFADMSGVHVIVSPDTNNPTDVMAVRQPASLPWPEESVKRALKASEIFAHWEVYC